jgi:hypothetical protein
MIYWTNGFHVVGESETLTATSRTRFRHRNVLITLDEIRLEVFGGRVALEMNRKPAKDRTRQMTAGRRTE